MMFVGMVDATFKNQGAGGKKWDKLHSITKELRKNAGKIEGQSSFGGTKALIRTGSLRRSVTFEKIGNAHYEVGVNRNAKGADGKPVANIAQINEVGSVLIPVTDKMRRYFMFLFLSGVLKRPGWPPKNKAFIVIRQRSFLASTMKEFAKGAKARTYARWVNYMMGVSKADAKFLGSFRATKGGGK
jgi:hypothetical protein